MFKAFRQSMRDLADQHLNGRHAVLEQKTKNLHDMLQNMTAEQHRWWFQDRQVQTFDDLTSVEITDGDRIYHAQSQYGNVYAPFQQGEVLVTNSGSTQTEKNFSFSLENWWRYIAIASRGLTAHGVGPDDIVLSTDIGRLQAGYRALEDAAAWICGATVLRYRAAALPTILDLCHKFGVTVLISNDKKLHRMAKILQEQGRPLQIRCVIQTGMPLTEPGELCEAFGVPYIVDYYGEVSIGNIYWVCPSGQRHVNDDAIHTVQKKGMTYFSNLLSLPVWNYDIGQENLVYSYRGCCDCGSHLPTVDKFVPKSHVSLRKE